jgi:hypothetical protein
MHLLNFGVEEVVEPEDPLLLVEEVVHTDGL